MDFSQRIYFNDKQLILTTDKEAYIDANPGAGNYTSFDGATPKSFTLAVQQLEKPGINGAIIEDASADSLTSQLAAMYRSIDAGGGLVHNERNEILMIFRKGKWGLPKGKLDDGEEISDCALREVKEETGLKLLVPEEKIGETYHIYQQNNEQIIKRTTWYRMRGTSDDKLKPQKEENILEARWVSIKDLASLVSKSYQAIKEVLITAGLEW